MALTLPVWAQEPGFTIADPDAVPEPMPMLDTNGYDIENFLLLGSDTTNPVNAGRTDVMVIVSVNRSAGSVAMLSIPRDLYVYIPGHEVYRINSAYGYGEHDGTGGFALLAETIRYNLGLEIDHYARVDFNDFRQIVDALGGIEISVDCAIQDWRLKEPDLDPAVEDNWELFTLPIGLHEMDGDLALWYARSRRTSSDFDRGRRHQALLKALWQRVVGLNLIDQLSDIYPQVLETVETDIQLGDLLDLVPLALSLDSSRIASYTFRQYTETQPWLSPEGSSVLTPQREAIRALELKMIQPPTANQLVREHARVEVINGTGLRSMARVAADRLAREGFVATIGSDAPAYQPRTMIHDYTGRGKGSSLSALAAVLRVPEADIVSEPDPNRTVDFRVVLGGSYASCTYNVAPPQ
ncbi:MAG: LCP family protein [Anaerolineae bacterium]|nr:LCP family protein [Anaerolineae bacterium]